MDNTKPRTMAYTPSPYILEKKNNYIIILSMFLFVIFIIEIIVAIRYNSHTSDIITPSNPVCHSDWSCNTENGNVDNTLHANHVQIVKNKDNFLTSIPSTTYPNNNALSTTNPYYGCKDPAYNSNGSYDQIPTLSGGDVYQYGSGNLSAYTGNMTAGVPTKTLFCIPTSGGSPQPTFLPTT